MRESLLISSHSNTLAEGVCYGQKCHKRKVNSKHFKILQALSVVLAGQVATVGQQDEQLFQVLARMAERRLDKFTVQGFANTAWAFATVGQQDEQLFKALARMAERHLDEINAQNLANAAWAFATVGQQDEQLFKAFWKAL